MSEDPFVYPGYGVLRNRFEIRDPAELDRVERRLVEVRIWQGLPSGAFDLKHLRGLHHHLFQDLYDWAGDIRTVEIAKGGSRFQFRRFIETGMADVHRRLVEARFLRGLEREAFAHAAARIIGDINYVHPFRDGNGRVQLFYLDQLAEQAGHALDLTRINPTRWIEASRASHLGDYDLMTAEIARIIDGPD